MKQLKHAIIKSKKIECLIGFILLLPPFLAVIAFLWNWMFINSSSDFGGQFSRMRGLSGIWSAGSEGESEITLVFLGLLAIAGAYMVKNSLYAFFVTEESDKKEEQQ